MRVFFDCARSQYSNDVILLAGLTGFALFISIAGIFLSLFMLFVPVVDAKYGKLTRLARALTEMRVAFILSTTGTVFSLLIASALFVIVYD